MDFFMGEKSSSNLKSLERLGLSRVVSANRGVSNGNNRNYYNYGESESKNELNNTNNSFMSSSRGGNRSYLRESRQSNLTNSNNNKNKSNLSFKNNNSQHMLTEDRPFCEITEDNQEQVFINMKIQKNKGSFLISN